MQINPFKIESLGNAEKAPDFSEAFCIFSVCLLVGDLDESVVPGFEWEAFGDHFILGRREREDDGPNERPFHREGRQ
jgi:hypothetical protein